MGFTTLPLSLRIEILLLNADVAQLVEQSIRNRQVIGSSPIVGSIYFVPLRGKPLKTLLGLQQCLAPDVRRSARGRPPGVFAKSLRSKPPESDFHPKLRLCALMQRARRVVGLTLDSIFAALFNQIN